MALAQLVAAGGKGPRVGPAGGGPAIDAHGPSPTRTSRGGAGVARRAAPAGGRVWGTRRWCRRTRRIPPAATRCRAQNPSARGATRVLVARLQCALLGLPGHLAPRDT